MFNGEVRAWTGCRVICLHKHSTVAAKATENALQQGESVETLNAKR
jgi:hypothetical protein